MPLPWALFPAVAYAAAKEVLWALRLPDDPKKEKDVCCFITTLFLLGPRAVILIWWLVSPGRFGATFDTFIWPALGTIFVPWTTLMYVLVAPGGVFGLDWLWLGIAVIADIGMHAGGGFGNRDRIGGRS